MKLFFHRFFLLTCFLCYCYCCSTCLAWNRKHSLGKVPLRLSKEERSRHVFQLNTAMTFAQAKADGVERSQKIPVHSFTDDIARQFICRQCLATKCSRWRPPNICKRYKNSHEILECVEYEACEFAMCSMCAFPEPFEKAIERYVVQCGQHVKAILETIHNTHELEQHASLHSNASEMDKFSLLMKAKMPLLPSSKPLIQRKRDQLAFPAQYEAPFEKVFVNETLPWTCQEDGDRLQKQWMALKRKAVDLNMDQETLARVEKWAQELTLKCPEWTDWRDKVAKPGAWLPHLLKFMNDVVNRRTEAEEKGFE